MSDSTEENGGTPQDNSHPPSEPLIRRQTRRADRNHPPDGPLAKPADISHPPSGPI